MNALSGACELKDDLSLNSHWAVAVFAARESVATLEDVVRAVVIACAGHAVRIEILINGNFELAQGLAHRFEVEPIAAESNVRLCIWFISVKDKALAWNTYVHRLYRGAGLTFFLDGYARPEADALKELALALSDDMQALAASGVPSSGRRADKHAKGMRRSGGLHGSMFALRRLPMDEIRRRGFRLPLGLYRTDSLIGAALCFGFDPACNDWNASRIRVQPTATWRFKSLQWWRLEDLKTHLKRKGRQAQGVLENLAVRDHLAERRQAPESLPRTVRELVLQWWHSESGPSWHQILLNPTCLLVMRRFRTACDWSLADAEPTEVYRNDVDRH